MAMGMRGFSLIEMMLVVAVLAVMAALAVPAMGPQVNTAKLEGTAEAVAALLGRAQAEAMAAKRCVRVRIAGSDVIAERLNAFDCDVSPATAPLIDATAPMWIEVGRTRADSAALTLTWDPAPSETTAAALGGSEPDQLRFRPSGRLWSNDTDVTDDDGVISVTSSQVSAPGNKKKTLVEAQGLICVLDRGQSPGGSGNNLTCP